MRLPAKLSALVIALLVVSQFFAVVGESQLAALLSWYLIYALIILIPLTLLYEGFRRLYPESLS
ncbi:hypothetical protein SAMN04488133_3022 [Halobellus limi]|uniref:Uncharacterized protein n=1 Tax=Halobellus limi TaxID=699433 RepID=A0A1H6BTX5_9EURY|nr:hypothetical protein SAMN04488133_3022 [Halobellus limi]